MSAPWLENDSRKEADARIEQDLVNGIAREFLAEQRRARRWGIAFKLFGTGVVILLLVIFLSDGTDISSARLERAQHTALIDIQGVIIGSEPAGADYVAAGLRAAYEDDKTAGIILRINSPGGSPVQAGYVNDEINRLKSEHPDIPVYAVIGDLCASGGYYVAVAADRIYADKASLVGSIGVVMGGFGFVDTLNKLGMERRVYHAGANKAFLDPFQPTQDEEVAHVNALLDNVYQQFVETVRQARGDRLSEDERIFSGLIWTGEQSLGLGLIDGLGNADYVARELIGAEDIVDFTYRDTLLEQFSKELGTLFRNSARIF